MNIKTASKIGNFIIVCALIYIIYNAYFSDAGEEPYFLIKITQLFEQIIIFKNWTYLHLDFIYQDILGLAFYVGEGIHQIIFIILGAYLFGKIVFLIIDFIYLFINDNGIFFNSLSNENSIHHFVTQRFNGKIGKTRGQYENFNLSLDVGDQSLLVMKNRKLLAKDIQSQLSKFIFFNADGSGKIQKVGKGDKGKGTKDSYDAIKSDGIITQEKELVLSGLYADSLPVIIYAKDKQVIGVFNISESSMNNNVIDNLLEILENDYYVDLGKLKICFGPSLEDLNKRVIDKLLFKGISEKNIEESKDSNYVEDIESSEYFSIKAAGGKETGRFSAGIYLKNKQK